MNPVGERAVARDTGGAQSHPLDRASVTAAEVPPAPGTNRAHGATSKPGRPQFAVTDLLPAKPASWYTGRGPNGPCLHCGARVMRRIEQEDGGAKLRVLHGKDCKR